MANIDNVQLPDGSSYNIVDNTSGFATQNYVDSAVSSVTKTTIGLGNVDNTSDLSKPVSTPQQTAIDTAVAPKANQTLLAPVESTTTASQTYQIGDQFIYNGLLYKATAVINSGGTITLNGNCVVSVSVTEQIKKIDTIQDGSGYLGVSINVDSAFTLLKKNVHLIEFQLRTAGGQALTTASTQIAELPEGYRPLTNVIGEVVGLNSNGSAITTNGYVLILANGKVYTMMKETAYYCSFHITFISK